MALYFGCALGAKNKDERIKRLHKQDEGKDGKTKDTLNLERLICFIFSSLLFTSQSLLSFRPCSLFFQLIFLHNHFLNLNIFSVLLNENRYTHGITALGCKVSNNVFKLLPSRFVGNGKALRLVFGEKTF